MRLVYQSAQSPTDSEQLPCREKFIRKKKTKKQKKPLEDFAFQKYWPLVLFSRSGKLVPHLVS